MLGLISKFGGSYATLKGGSPLRMWVAATGCRDVELWSNKRSKGKWALQTVDLSASAAPRKSWGVKTVKSGKELPDKALFELLMQYDGANNVLAASIAPGEGEEKRSDGLIAGHAYSLIRVADLDVKGQSERREKSNRRRVDSSGSVDSARRRMARRRLPPTACFRDAAPPDSIAC